MDKSLYCGFCRKDLVRQESKFRTGGLRNVSRPGVKELFTELFGTMIREGGEGS